MSNIAAQLYTVRDFCQTAEGLAESCAKIKKMGYDGVQLSCIGPIEPKEVKRILDGEGLACVATHVGLDRLEKETEKVIEEHLLWGCRYPAIGGFSPSEEEGWCLEAWNHFVTRFNALADRFGAADMRLGYHNHWFEFAPLPGGIRPYDYLLGQLGANAWFELDTCWVSAGAADPAAYIRRAAGRIPCIHFKDMTLNRKREYKLTEIGDGNLNWPEIIQSCRYSGVQWYIVERDEGDLDAFASLERSLKNMRNNMGL